MATPLLLSSGHLRREPWLPFRKTDHCQCIAGTVSGPLSWRFSSPV